MLYFHKITGLYAFLTVYLSYLSKTFFCHLNQINDLLIKGKNKKIICFIYISTSCLAFVMRIFYILSDVFKPYSFLRVKLLFQSSNNESNKTCESLWLHTILIRFFKYSKSVAAHHSHSSF